MRVLLTEILGSWVRIALGVATAFLIDRHVLTADQGSRLSELLYTHILDFAPIAIAMLWALLKNRRWFVQLHTALQMPAGSSVDSLKARISNGLGESATRASAIVLAIVLAGTATACATANKLARQADASFAAAVFALDDAEWTVYQACRPEPACEARHARLNPPIKKALSDVKALTIAVQAAPSGVPMSLPDLLLDLAAVRTALEAEAVVLPDVSQKLATANQKALNLLASLVGGR